MWKLFCFLIAFSLSSEIISQIEDIPIDVSENWGTYKHDAVTTSLKNAYEPALWLGSFDKYIAQKNEVTKLSEITSGYYRVTLKSFCMRPAQPMGGEGYGSLIAPLKGKKAKLIQYVIKRWSSNKQIEQKDVQILIWGIIAGLDYSDYPNDFRKKIDPLLPDNEKKPGLGIKVGDLLELPLPEEIKAQLRAFQDIKGLIKAGISRYEDIERIAVPDGNPVPNANDRDIPPGTWTLLDNGYYVRAFLGDYKSTPIEVYKPDHVDVVYDSKQRIISMKNSAGMIEIEYDDSEGANIITYGGNSYFINRIKSYKLDGISNNTFVDLLWYSHFNSKSTINSGYKRMLDPPENLYLQRDEQVNAYINVLKKYCEKKKSKLAETDIEKIYNIKQVEMCFKNLIDMSNVMIGGEEREKFSRIVIDATLEIVNDIVPGNKLPEGGSNNTGFGFGLMVAVPAADGGQKIGIPGQDDEEHIKVFLRNIDCSLLPEPEVLYTARLEIVNNTRQIDEVIFDLFDITYEPGRFMNDKRQRDNRDLDMIFSQNPGYEVSQSFIWPNFYTATGNGSSPLSINIRATDYGAYAKLKARVVIEGVTYYAVADGNGAYLTIPCDANDNHVADSWERENDAVDLPANWDDDNLPANDGVKGDGMTLFEEYRGFYVLRSTLTPMHIRTKPKTKELFVIDNDLILSLAAWEHASGIPHYKLSEDQVLGNLAGDFRSNPDYRKVNFCSGFAAGNKYAVYLLKLNGLSDPYYVTCGDGLTTYWGCSEYGPPVNVNYTVVLPDVIRKHFTEFRDTLSNALTSVPGLEWYDTYYGRFSRENVERYVRVLNNEEKMDLLVDFMTMKVAIHEVGHACAIEHHSPTESGDELCPMRYNYHNRFVSVYGLHYEHIFTQLDTDDFLPVVSIQYYSFCSSVNNCNSQINVNDRR